MEETEDSTTDTDGYPVDDRQGIVDTMVTVMLQLIMEDPWISIPNMMDRMTEFGPLHDRDGIMEVFRGRPIFRRTTSRLEVVRAAAVNGTLRELPISTRVPENERVGVTIPGTDRYIGWWAPQVECDGFIFPVNMITVPGGVLYRYPHEEEDTEAYFRGEDDKSTEEENTEDE